jgi:tetraacyldisaccharide 4'-kinase
MNSIDHFLNSFRLLLFPAALLYGMVVRLRNLAYDKGWLPSQSFNLPLICIGNLSVGGTGKSPLTEHLIAILKDRYRVAALSRGYKRRTRGYVLAGEGTTALEIGDEPMQLHLKHPEVPVAVGEARAEALPQLLFDRPGTEVVILDDAFQHRAVKAGLNILLTDRNNLYTRDFLLPTGDLRDRRSSANRADIVIVTKCPQSMSPAEADSIRMELRLNEGQELFFTSIAHDEAYHFTTHRRRPLGRETEALLFTGIANPGPLKNHLQETLNSYEEIRFSDHHLFDIDDVKGILRRFSAMESEEKVMLTTEKDAVRLGRFASVLKDEPLFIVPIRVEFLFGDEERFRRRIFNFIETFKEGDAREKGR